MTVLIDAAELADRLAGPEPPLVLDVRWNLTGRPGYQEYREGHIPGSRWVDLERDLARPASATVTGGRHPLPDPQTFAAAMRRLGLHADQPVVLTDGGPSLAAARLWWLLGDSGHTPVRVLDGGVAGWVAAGYPVQTGDSPAVAAPGDVSLTPGQWSVADADEVTAALAAGHRVVDVRAGERFRGEQEPMDPVAGHIPGAVNRPSAAHVVDGRFAAADVLRQRLGDLDELDVVYCGSGVTAAQTLLAMAVAGLPRPRLYAGSWSDWVSDRSRPVATGPEPG